MINVKVLVVILIIILVREEGNNQINNIQLCNAHVENTYARGTKCFTNT